MKLNIGAGAERFPGFKNVDFDERENPDYNFNVEMVMSSSTSQKMGGGYPLLVLELKLRVN